MRLWACPLLLLPTLLYADQQPNEPSCQYQDAPHRQIKSQDLLHGLHHIVEDDELELGCTDGYKLNGESFIWCDIGGSWDPPELPQCEEIRCELPERDHLIARLDGTDAQLAAGTNLIYNKQVAWKCEQGYTLMPHGAALGTCNSNWQKKIPSCQAVRCPPIDRPEHGEQVIHDSRSLRGRWRVGSSVVAECNDGYTLLGTRTRFCTLAGSWNGTLQICDNGRSTCRSPGTPIGGTKHGDRYNRGNKVTFSCSTGHTLLGSAERVCLDNGEWTGEETRCIAPNEYMTEEEVVMRLGNGIAKMSEKSTDTKLQRDKLNDLRGKQVLLGKNKMQNMNRRTRRSTIEELRDNGGLDVYFVLDTSGSITKDEKNTSVEIIKELVDLVGVSAEKGGTGFGFLAFDSKVWKTVAVAEKNNTTAIIQFLDGFKTEMFNRLQGGTAPATAFEKLKALIQTRIYANIEKMKNRASAIILLSDGIKNEGGDPVNIRNHLTDQAKTIGHQIHVYCIGVGNTNKDLLNKLATNGTDYLVLLKDLNELQQVVVKLYNGSARFGQCGVQGQPYVYADNIKDVQAEAGTWRWVGGLYHHKENNPPENMDAQFMVSKFQCGVSLITNGPSKRQSAWVLTAAHCVHDIRKKDVRKLMVKLGSLNSSTTLQDGTVVRVKKIIKHPLYNRTTLVHDIALLELNEQIPFAFDIRPVCLHKPNDDYIAVNTVAKMTGWGWLSMTNNRISPTLKQLSVKIQTNESCTRSTRDITSKFEYPNNFCAGNVEVNGTLLDACTFDSGSPLVVCHKADDLKNVCTQVGLVSSGDGCGEPGKYGVYTNTTTYYNWIMSEIQRRGQT